MYSMLSMTHRLAANQGKAASAIAYFEEAIDLIQSEYGDDSVKLIPLYQMVGKVEQSRDGANHSKSIDAYLQAHSIANAKYVHSGYNQGIID